MVVKRGKLAAGKNIKSNTVTTISEYISIIESLTGNIWFRGHGQANNYKLQPTLYRTKPQKSHKELYEIEFDMIKRFRQRGLPFIGDKRIDDDKLDILFFMQHYSIPTRLLDWSENPNVALYFALNDASNYAGKNRYKDDCAIWMLDPKLWNATSLDTDLGILSWPEDDPVKGYLPLQSKEKIPAKQMFPSAISGRQNNPRIVAQKGVFVIYGQDVRDMEEIFLSGDYNEKALSKILIPKEHITTMRNSLERMGITDSTIYPDLQGLAYEIRRMYGY